MQKQQEESERFPHDLAPLTPSGVALANLECHSNASNHIEAVCIKETQRNVMQGTVKSIKQVKILAL